MLKQSKTLYTCPRDIPAMPIPAKYEDGVFKPLEDVNLAEGTRVDVYVPPDRQVRPKSLRDLAAFGMWADRDDITDGVTYEDDMRRPRGGSVGHDGAPR
jgi:predicted DNA-binding antitoxin AbrB/MazE fold protein